MLLLGPQSLGVVEVEALRIQLAALAVLVAVVLEASTQVPKRLTDRQTPAVEVEAKEIPLVMETVVLE
jgi:hypothetical protein